MKTSWLSHSSDRIGRELVDTSSYPNSPFRRGYWAGLIFEEARHRDVTSGRIGDGDFEVISAFTRSEYGDKRLFVVDLTNRLKVTRFQPRAFENSLAAYSRFKRDPALIEYFLFAETLEWVVWASHDWWIFGTAATRLPGLVHSYGGWPRIRARIEQEFGTRVSGAVRSSTPKEAAWRTFVHNIWRL